MPTKIFTVILIASLLYVNSVFAGTESTTSPAQGSNDTRTEVDFCGDYTTTKAEKECYQAEINDRSLAGQVGEDGNDYPKYRNRFTY